MMATNTFNETLDTDLVPAVKPGSQRLMVVLHGLGDSMEGYRWLPEMLGLPWLNYLLVNAPDAYYGGHSWFDVPVSGPVEVPVVVEPVIMPVVPYVEVVV